MERISYATRVRRVSELMRDQKEKPLDRVVYWIEYIIRHQGASHLRSSSRHLNLFQRNLNDIALALFTSIIVAVYIIVRLINYKRRASSTDSSERCKRDKSE